MSARIEQKSKNAKHKPALGRILGAAACVGLGAALLAEMCLKPGSSAQKSASNESSESSMPSRLGSEPEPIKSESQAQAFASQATGAFSASTPLLAPSLNEIREEVKIDPHQTPASLIRFARKVGERMERAKASAQEARSLMGELESCVQNEDSSIAPSAQVFCLQNAAELARLEPELSERAGRLRQLASAEVIQQLEAYETLIRTSTQ